ncbi:MAG: zf-HC2 domain-containing protein [Elusimicrobiota bacterium]
MGCNEVKKEIYLYITNEIDAVKKSELEKHLFVCSVCRNIHGNFVKLLNGINKNQIECPRKNWDYFAEKILDRIYEKKRFVFLKPVVALVFSLLIFVISYRYYYQKNVVLSDTEELVAYLSDFDIPELNQ